MTASLEGKMTVSVVQIHREDRKRIIVTYKVIKRVDQFYDLRLFGHIAKNYFLQEMIAFSYPTTIHIPYFLE